MNALLTSHCVAAIGLLLYTLSPGVVRAEDNPDKATYLRYCGACHGSGGKGDGVVSHVMTPKPSDLTQLAKANKGAFPYVRVMQSIDGRESTRAHGDPDMPVWGDIFVADQSMTPTRQAVVRGKVMLITDYLSSIQEK